MSQPQKLASPPDGSSEDAYDPQSIPTRKTHEPLEELRELLLGREQAEIKRLRGELSRAPNAESLARSLPEAVKLCGEKNAALEYALTPTVESALRNSVRKDPKPLLDVIFPLLGPAIRKAIQNALDGMIGSLNQATSNSLNPLVRYQAWKAGIPFGEYVLLQNLVFRVEQVLWIHVETGILLLEAHQRQSQLQDGDLVAGMMTAMQQFARDSFHLSEQDSLREFRVGDFQVLVVAGQKTQLAAAVRGTPPRDLLPQMTECIEAIEYRNGPDLDVFSGDMGPFEASKDQLQRLLQYERKPISTRPSTGTKLILAAAAIGLGCLLGFWQLDRYRFRSLVDNIEKVPGYTIARAERGWLGGGEIWGLQDPLADSLKPVFDGLWIRPESVSLHWKPYYSVEASIVSQRVRQNLKAPKTVQVVFQDGILTVSGLAPEKFILQSRVLANSLPGVSSYIDSGLEDIDPGNRIRNHLDMPATAHYDFKAGFVTISGSAPHEWIEAAKAKLKKEKDVSGSSFEALQDLDLVIYERLIKRIGDLPVYYVGGKTDMLEGGQGALSEVANLWKQLKVKGELLKKSAVLVATGQSDKPGSRELNIKLCRARAEAAKQELVKLGIKPDDLQIDSLISNTEDPRLRRVIFLVKEKL